MTEVKETTKPVLVKVTISTDITINGVKFAPGTHEVEAGVADDLKRMDDNYNKYLAGLNRNNPTNGNLGSVSAA